MFGMFSKKARERKQEEAGREIIAIVESAAMIRAVEKSFANVATDNEWQKRAVDALRLAVPEYFNATTLYILPCTTDDFVFGKDAKEDHKYLVNIRHRCRLFTEHLALYQYLNEAIQWYRYWLKEEVAAA